MLSIVFFRTECDGESNKEFEKAFFLFCSVVVGGTSGLHFRSLCNIESCLYIPVTILVKLAAS